MDARQTRQVLLAVWLILSAGGALVLLAPHVLPPDSVARAAAHLELPHHHCFFCGMTRSFLLVSRGDLRGASSLHRGAVPLYVALLANELAALGTLWWELSTRGPRRRTPAPPHVTMGATCSL